MKIKHFISNAAVMFAACCFSLSGQQNKGDSLYAVGNYSQAIEAYKLQESTEASLDFRIGKAYHQLGNLQKAQQYYRKAYQQNMDFVEAGLSYGKLLQQHSGYVAADSLFTDLTERFPDNPGLHYQLGLAKEQQKDSSGIKQFQRVIRLNPQHQNALYRAGIYHYRHREFDEVEALGKQALETYPENTPMWRLLAKNAEQLSDYHTAIERYKHLTEKLQPKTIDYKDLGFAYYKVLDFKNAIKVYEKIVEMGEEDAEILYSLGVLYHREGEYEKAKEIFTTTISMKKFGLDKQYQSLALAYKSMNDHKRAIHFFKEALTENPLLARSQYEMAVSADNYFEDKKTIRDYYQLVIDKFKNSSDASHYVNLSEHRVKDLNKELFMKGEDK